MILNQAQAQAVYRAMCELNNVGGVIEVRIGAIEVVDFSAGVSVVRRDRANGLRLVEGEDYINQEAFAAAYGV